MQKNILIIIGLILLALGVWFLTRPDATFGPGESNNADGEQNTAENGGQIDNAEDWESFQSGPTGTGWRFSVDHPPEVNASTIRDTIYEFKYIGPESEPNTEITDGYYISVQLLPNEDLRSYSEIDAALGEVTSTTFNGKHARTYQTETELGTVTDHITFMLENGSSTLVDISYSTYADADDSYQETVDAMFATLTFSAPESAGLSDRIRVETPGDRDVVQSPLSVEGEARGTWYFEASFPAVLVDWDGRIIAEGPATAEGEWMTEEFVPFKAELEFESPYSDGDPDFMQNGTLILQRANPSGLPENDAALEIPVRFAP